MNQASDAHVVPLLIGGADLIEDLVDLLAAISPEFRAVDLDLFGLLQTQAPTSEPKQPWMHAVPKVLAVRWNDLTDQERLIIRTMAEVAVAQD